MIIWTIKLLNTARRAIAGRKHPHQLAWAVAFGLLLGIVPHGNLLALGLLIVVLSLKLNHAMAGLTAIGASFGATLLDPYSHQVGDAVLTHPDLSVAAAKVWQLPLVPWTDLNNTVVVGSFLIGVAALVPVFIITYPIFRLFAPAADPEPSDVSEQADRVDRNDRDTHEIIVVEQGHDQVARPHPAPEPVADPAGESAETLPTLEVLPAESDGDRSAAEDSRDVAVETRIDVIRMKDYREAPTSGQAAAAEEAGQAEQEQPMDEALSYLLRQLRDSQQRKVA